MQKFIVRLVAALFLCAAATVLSIPMIASSHALKVQGQGPTQSGNPSAYLELSVEPFLVNPGTLVTLHITYHNIGLVYTGITANPPDLVAFEPPLTMPCKYNEHPDGCRTITFRTLATGIVKFKAGATGEVWDEDCKCWYWGGAADNGPARLVITDFIWERFLPFVQQQVVAE